jgi:hypothetical protein
MPKHVGVKNLKNLERINKEFLEHLSVFSQTVRTPIEPSLIGHQRRTYQINRFQAIGFIQREFTIV